MSKRIQKAIRAALLAAPDGMSAGEIIRQTGITASSVYVALLNMPDCYIDHWRPRGSQYVAIWMCVEVPEHAPKPEPKQRVAQSILA